MSFHRCYALVNSLYTSHMNDAALQRSTPFWKQKVNYTKWTVRHGGMFPAGIFALHFWTKENKQKKKERKKKPLVVIMSFY